MELEDIPIFQMLALSPEFQKPRLWDGSKNRPFLYQFLERAE